MKALLSAAVLAGGWYLFADLFQRVNPVVLPPLGSVISRLAEIGAGGELTANLFATLARYGAGLALGIVAGLLLGAALSASRTLASLLELPLEMLRSIPATALLPVFFVLFGVGSEAKIAMVSFPTALLMSINTYYGLSRVSTERLRAGKVFGASRLQCFCRISLPEALPQVFVGLRLSVSLALVVAIASEMFVGTALGLGQKIFESYLMSSSPSLYAYLLATGLTGFAINKLFLMFEARTLHWVEHAVP